MTFPLLLFRKIDVKDAEIICWRKKGRKAENWRRKVGVHKMGKLVLHERSALFVMS